MKAVSSIISCLCKEPNKQFHYRYARIHRDSEFCKEILPPIRTYILRDAMMQKYLSRHGMYIKGGQIYCHAYGFIVFPEFKDMMIRHDIMSHVDDVMYEFIGNRIRELNFFYAIVPTEKRAVQLTNLWNKSTEVR